MSHPYKTRVGGATVTVFVPYDCANHCPFCINKKEYADCSGFSLEAILRSIRTMDSITPECDFVFTGGEPLADLDALQKMLDAIPATHKIYINTTFPVQPHCPAEDMLAFTEKNKDIRAKYETVVLNKTRKWDAELVTTYVGNTTMPLAARTMSWTSEDASVATVTPEGLVTPVANGETVITGVRGEITVNINVKVQIAGSEVAPADRLMRVADWKTTNIGMASVSLTPNENGTNVDYVIKSPRGARISVLPEADIFSHPQSVRVRLNPGTAKVTDVTITLKANNAIGVVSKKFTDVKADETNVYEMPVADYFDVSDIGIYPIRFVSVAMGIGGKTKTDYHVEIPGIEAVYDESTLSVNDIKADDNDNADSRFFNIDGDTVTVSAPADIVIVDAAGRTIAAYSGVTAVTLPKGVAVVSATTADGIVHALKVVR